MRSKKKKPTMKEISFKVQMMEEMFEGIHKFILTPLVKSIDVLTITLNEYVEMNGDGENLIRHLKQKAKDEKSKDRSPKKGKKESTKRSGASKGVGKDSKGV
jgi:hypothetical protein